jgi:hypothetical protein
LEQPIGGTQAIITNRKFTRLNVDRDNLTLMILLDLEPDFGFIERISPLGKLFFTISGLSDGHRAYLAAISDVPIIAWVKARSVPLGNQCARDFCRRGCAIAVGEAGGFECWRRVDLCAVCPSTFGGCLSNILTRHRHPSECNGAYRGNNPSSVTRGNSQVGNLISAHKISEALTDKSAG